MALSMSRSSSLAWLFWGSVCSSPRTYFRAFSYSYTRKTHIHPSLSQHSYPLEGPSLHLPWGLLPLPPPPSPSPAPPNGVESTNNPNCGDDKLGEITPKARGCTPILTSPFPHTLSTLILSLTFPQHPDLLSLCTSVPDTTRCLLSSLALPWRKSRGCHGPSKQDGVGRELSALP